MTYATKQDLIDRFGELALMQLTDRTNVPPVSVDDSVLLRALADADALCDGYLGKSYTLPLSQVPPFLVKIASDLAFYYLHGARISADHPAMLAYKSAEKWLENVARGLVTLDSAGNALAAAGGGSVKAKASDRVFTRDSLRSA